MGETKDKAESAGTAVAEAIGLFGRAGRPFNGRLIAPPNDPTWTDGCPYCAQGLVLHTLAGYSDADLRRLDQDKADAEVARRLGVSCAEAVLLRLVNDSGPGLPQRVLILADDGIGSIIGAEWRVVLSFWRYLNSMTAAQWAATRAAAWTAAGDAAGEAAGDAARDAAGDAARRAAGDAAWTAVGATYEIMGRSRLKSFYFLPFFGFASPDAIPLHPDVVGR